MVATVPTPADALFAAHQRVAFTVAARFGRRCPWLTDDFTSDALLALWQAARKYAADPTTFAKVAFTVCRRACLTRIRTEKNRNPPAFGRRPLGDQEHDPAALVAAHGPPVGAGLDLADLVGALPGGERVLVEGVIRGETFTKIGADVGTTGTRVRQRVGRALQRLRGILG